MTDSAEKIALRNAFAKKLGKNEAATLYVNKNDIDTLSISVEKTILAEQIIGLYNGYMGTSLDYTQYNTIELEQWDEAMRELGRGYKGE